MTLDKLNARLKAAKIGVSVRIRGDRLNLRATLPPKPGETEWKQRDIPLGIYANPAGLKRAEAEARKLGGQLACKEFKWDDWVKPDTPEADVVSDWIDRFETNYFNSRKRDSKSQTTWDTDYLQPFRQLPSDAPLTSELLHQSILETKPDTRARQRRCMALGALARFAELELNAAALKGKYNPKRAAPRDLPSDQEISQWRDLIYEKNESWGWAFGMMACYGLRNHELFYLDLDRLRESPVLHVVEHDDGNAPKTGIRRIWACYPEWWEQWHLWDVKFPQVTGKTNRDLGGRVTQAFGRYGFKKPYNLRHRWAVRTIEFDIPIELISRQMGHSLTIHHEIYHAWIPDDIHQRAFDRAMLRPDRPFPP